MIKYNQDPHKEGYSLGPTHHVTAVFESSDNMATVVQALNRAGFKDEDVEVFAGKEGAEKLDFAGKRHGILARLRRSLEMIFADETDMLRKIDMTLRRGGMAVIVRVDTDEDKKKRAAEACKNNDASEICYWGRLAVERMWVKESSVPVPPHSIMPPA